MKKELLLTPPLDPWLTPRSPVAGAASRDDRTAEALRQAKAVIGALMTPHRRFPSARRLTKAWTALQAV